MWKIVKIKVVILWKKEEKVVTVSKAISFLLNQISLIVLAVILVLFIGGRFELANATQPNVQSEIQKLTSCYAWNLCHW